MKVFLLVVALYSPLVILAQKRINPVIKNAGAVFVIPDAVEKPDPLLTYKIIVELESGSENPKSINQALNTLARMINLHVSGGVPKENLDIVVAVHGEATFTLTDSNTYEKRYNAPNPNLELYNELAEAGVKFVVCGQSLAARGVERSTLIPQVKIATSMLTAVTTHQLKGYAYLKF